MDDPRWFSGHMFKVQGQIYVILVSTASKYEFCSDQITWVTQVTYCFGNLVYHPLTFSQM